MTSVPGFFKYVSAANYFGEICEWWGFAVAARLNPAALFFAGFTTLFLGVRGLQNHK
jgi:steroid 5-alpha reductase family enzyme